MSRPRLAELTGLARSTVHKLITDRPPASIEPLQLTKLAGVLGVGPDVLLRLWSNEVVEVEVEVDESAAVLRGWALAREGVPADVLREALDIAALAIDQRMRNRA